ncbi:MAG TPA: hypothetical protein VHG27_06015 [Xanthobacteraceae bacterium]|nr:hypothetical protein [Xanthobacteraceae bacterium]
MSVSRVRSAVQRVALGFAAVAVFSASTFAADRLRCLSPKERRAAIVNNQAVPLGRAVRTVRNRGEVVRARLCESEQGLVYMLTVLSRNGKVTRATIDARNGQLLKRP